ncbi:MAG: hypothetical protein M3Y59_06165 [Myxococcota bacterium]|nr:hypothetical protein [Myxococcota bacterium]
MIDPALRRPVTPVQNAPTEAAAAPSGAPLSVATPFLRDTLEAAKRSGPVNLSGLGKVLSAGLSALLGRGPSEASAVGPRLLHLDAGWTPQGQGYDAKRQEVLTTYYDDSGVLLSVQDKNSGKETHQARLGGLGPEGPAPSHGGGVSTDGEFVYVSDTRNIFVYRREDIENAEQQGAPVQAFQVMAVPNPDQLKDPATGIDLVSAGSFMTVKDGFAYIGAYSKDGDGKVGAVWRYQLDEKTGALIEDSRQGPIRAPDRAQGMTVVDGALLFTTGDRKLVYQPIHPGTDTFQADLADRREISNGLIDPYAQGLNVIDGEVWVTYESGSHKYRDKLNPPFKPREHIQRIPLDLLDL